MSDFINTVSVIGDDALIDSIIDRSVTEVVDDRVTELRQDAFRPCGLLKRAIFPNVVACGNDAFRGCSALEEIYFPELTKILPSVFFGCSNLKKVTFPKVTNGGSDAFRQCVSLEVADFARLLNISTRFIYQCDKARALILRAETVCTLENISGVSSGSSSLIYIYVPRNLVEEYKAATNWSTYAAQFRVLEDYTVDGTTTGELDETKI